MIKSPFAAPRFKALRKWWRLKSSSAWLAVIYFSIAMYDDPVRSRSAPIASAQYSVGAPPNTHARTQASQSNAKQRECVCQQRNNTQPAAQQSTTQNPNTQSSDESEKGVQATLQATLQAAHQTKHKQTYQHSWRAAQTPRASTSELAHAALRQRLGLHHRRGRARIASCRGELSPGSTPCRPVSMHAT